MRIMISCGEASGDMYAGALAAELRRRAPDAESPACSMRAGD
jgi:lipid A disaccharide synthetase